MIFSGAPLAVFPNAAGSASSTVPITRRYSSFECTRSFSAARVYRSSCVTRRTSGSRGMDLPPLLTQPVKTQNPMNGELSHGIVTQAVHQGVRSEEHTSEL